MEPNENFSKCMGITRHVRLLPDLVRRQSSGCPHPALRGLGQPLQVRSLIRHGYPGATWSDMAAPRGPWVLRAGGHSDCVHTDSVPCPLNTIAISGRYDDGC